VDASQNASSIGLEKCDFGAPVLFLRNAKAPPVSSGSISRCLKARLGCAEQVMPAAKPAFAFLGGAFSPIGFKGFGPFGASPPTAKPEKLVQGIPDRFPCAFRLDLPHPPGPNINQIVGL